MEPVRDLGWKVPSQELKYVCDKGNLEELKSVLEIVRDQPLKTVCFTTKSLTPIVRYDIKTYARAREEDKDVALTAYVLQKVCHFIGERVKQTLEHLDMEGMPISKWLSLLNFHVSSTLTTVCLKHTRIGDAGCRKLLKNGLSPSISSLDLTGCYVTQTGVEILATLIAMQQDRRFYDRDFVGLKHLCLDYNKIMDAGASILIDLLVDDFSILSLEMRSCGLSRLEDAVDLVQFNKQLQVLDLRQNQIQEKTVAEVIKTLTTRHPIESTTYPWKDKKSLEKYLKICE